MSERSFDTSQHKDLLLSVPVPDGAMTGETFTVSITVSSGTSRSNAKTTRRSTSQAGSKNSKSNEKITVEDLERLFTSDEITETEATSTPRSHSGCWCNSSHQRGTNDVDSDSV